MATTTPQNASDLYKSQITEIALPSPVDKTAAKALIPQDGVKIYPQGPDGGLFIGGTGKPVGYYDDDGGIYYGTRFKPTGGDGSAGWELGDLVDLNTVNDMKALAFVSPGVSVIRTKEYATGSGIDSGGVYDVIDGIGTANGFNIIAHDTLPISFSLRIKSGKNYVGAFGAIPAGNSTTNVTAMQVAMDTVPIGSTLVWTETIPVTGTATHLLTLSRNVNLVSEGVRRSGIRADSVGATTSIFELNVSENGGFVGVRNWKMDGLTLFFNGGGKHCIEVTGGFPFITSQITNCNLTQGTHADSSVFHALAAWSHSSMDHCTLAGRVYGQFGDANRFHKNISFGNTIAYVFDLEAGIKNNVVENNTIVNRDGALHIIDGDMVRFINNQVEQFQENGENQSVPAASVYIEGATRISKSHVIEDNNFGGGTYVDYSIYLDNCQNTVIDKNNFVATDLVDIYCTTNSKFNVYEFTNSVVGTLLDPRPRDVFKAEITNLSGYNIQMPLNFLGQNGWSSPTEAYYKAKDGRVIFVKPISGGTGAIGTVAGSLAPGCWPIATLFAYSAMDIGGTLGYVTIPGTNGVITIGSIASNGGMWIYPIQSQMDSQDF